MSSYAKQIRYELFEAIDTIASEQDKWIKNPESDFTRKRHFTFKQVIKCILGFEAKSLGTELLEAFKFQRHIPTVSALCQARDKISSDAFLALFNQFQPEPKHCNLYHGYRLLAHDGSDLKIPLNRDDETTYINQGEKSCNLIHVNALYDLLNRNFKALSIENKCEYDERKSLIKMAEQLGKTSILIADRGYRSLNVYEHLREAGHYFVIRESDTTARNGLLNSLQLSQDKEFDKVIHFQLSRRQTKEVKTNPNIRLLSSTSKFDKLPPHQKTLYPMSLRVVRIKIGEERYESLVTNLPSNEFSTADLKKLYHLRWGIETAFRELKYTLGMNWFHAKKKELIKQEIIARFIMYNFSMQIAMGVEIKKNSTQYLYQINYTRAFSICCEYFKHPKCPVEDLIQNFILPVRPNRGDQRKIKVKPFVGFLYRIA